ncbi:MAG: asparagine synthase (glutamine-hydrolyzing) [Phycisphaeraceae bacterium]|nr:asparagine synthase (glutamine-hydrolyzing) [Phycisphaeraceae bacterium]
MCGICGIVSSAGISPRSEAAVRAMTGTMTHRGPDGDGAFAAGPVRLAMRRLAIIDLTGGWQPLYNEDESLALVANGEVYNFVELRTALEARGHQFRTKSDCETVLHLYEEHGLDFVHHLRGMYAIALWDSRRKRLVIVRDRMGEKPVYLHERTAPGGAREIHFASEMKSLLSGGLIPFGLDPAGVHDFMHFQWVPEPRTAVAGVRKLPAGHMLIVDTDPWRVEQRCYWRMEDAPPIELRDGHTPGSLIREQLNHISELIIRSDVPVGVALSGGLDSSAIAALAAAKYPGTMHAFTVGYKGRPRQDERGMARELADHLRLPIHEIEVDVDEVVDTFPSLCGMRDDPIDDLAGHGYWAVSREARAHGVPVLLQGQGGDELFRGYPWVNAAMLASAQKAGLVGGSSGCGDPSLLKSLLPKGGTRNHLVDYAYSMAGAVQGWGRLMPDRGSPPEQLVFFNVHKTWQAGAYTAPRLYTPRFGERAIAHNPADFFTLPRPWLGGGFAGLGVAMTKLISEGYMLENGMAQGDRLAMANSVELRLPLVDYRLVETVIGLRKAHPDHQMPPKTWFKDAISDVVPEFVRNRRKRGFAPPWQEWGAALQTKYAPDLADGYLVGCGAMRAEVMARLVRPRGRFSPWRDALQKILVLEHWARAMSTAAASPIGEAALQSSGAAQER